MPWQKQVCDVAFEIDEETNRYAYREVILTVPRQSGKTTLLLSAMVHRCVIMARLLQKPQRIGYTAQTAKDARTKWEEDHVKLLEHSVFNGQFNVRRAAGTEAIKWHNDSVHGLITPSTTGGHGMVLDAAFLDEAFAHVDARVEQAVRPAMITRREPQLWVVSTAGDDNSYYLREKVDRGREAAEAGITRGICYFEWSALDDDDPADPDTWLRCMPAIGFTQRLEDIRSEFLSMELAEFERAYLNRWTNGIAEPAIDPVLWNLLEDSDSSIAESSPLTFGVDVTPDRDFATIGVVGLRDDNDYHAEIVEHRAGTEWVPQRLAELTTRWDSRVFADLRGPAGALVAPCHILNVELEPVNAMHMGQACGLLYDAIMSKKLHHLGDIVLSSAVSGAAKRQREDTWVFSRRNSASNISPLIAITCAYWAAHDTPPVSDLVDLGTYADDDDDWN